MTVGLARPRRQYDRAHVQDAARAASSVSSVWLIVPRPGRAATTTRQPEHHREVAHAVLEAQRREQPADPLDDEHVGARRGRARGGDELLEVDRRAGELRGQMWRDRRLERPRADVRRPRARHPREQLVVMRPIALRRLADARSRPA